MKTRVNIFWFRRDLRLADNAGLFHALQSGLPVVPIFIFDRNILDKLENKRDARVEFIYHSLTMLQQKLIPLQSTLEVFYGKPAEVFSALLDTYQIGKVLVNEDYEPYARERDAEIENLLKSKGIGFHAFRDHVIFSKQDLVKDDGNPYTIFTPYSNKWKLLLFSEEKKYLSGFASENLVDFLFKQEAKQFPELDAIGFFPTGKKFPSSETNRVIIKDYSAQRDFPGRDATSRLGIHLRFGTLSIRQLTKEALKLSPVFLNELIWRDFYHMILWHFPKVGQGYAFKAAYEKIKWRNNENEFACWCEGLTGYPMVDAGMRQLNETGYMHNRLRMITASFLAKHLLIDWRWGEAYFAEQLLDYDLASNNGGWQWAAGSGCDAAPYFRIFNPSIQQKKFDSDGSFVKRWLPEFQELRYPPPIVEHRFARNRAIRVFQEGLMDNQ